MLVITRKPDESLLLFSGDGERIEIVTLSVKGNRVQYGIIAPKSVRVIRAEIEHKPRPTSKEAVTNEHA